MLTFVKNINLYKIFFLIHFLENNYFYNELLQYYHESSVKEVEKSQKIITISKYDSI